MKSGSEGSPAESGVARSARSAIGLALDVTRAWRGGSSLLRHDADAMTRKQLPAAAHAETIGGASDVRAAGSRDDRG